MKKFFTLIFCIIAINAIKAQEVVSSGGGDGETPNVSVSWTIGEPIIETHSNSNNTLTQGFQQSKLEVVKVSEHEIPDLEVNVFPNPTSDFITVNVTNNESEINLVFTDMNGKLMHKSVMHAEKYEHNMQNYQQGTYLLHIIVDGNKPLTYKIIKNN